MRVRIVEEGPGVPPEERYFVEVPGHGIVDNFGTLKDAKNWCITWGYEYAVEPYEP